MTDKVEAFNKLYDKLMMGKNEKYVPDGTVVSLAVYGLVDGRCVDSYFLYGTDGESFSEPYARISIAADSCEILFYKKEHGRIFREQEQVPESFFQEEAAIVYAEAYMEIRDFAFARELDEGQKKALKTYMEVFRQVIRDQFEACYLEMAEEFIRWAEPELGE